MKTINIEQLERVLNYLLDNNLKLEEQNKDKITIEIKGNAGIGKTAIIKEIANKRNANYIRLDLSSMEEVGDLLGIPIREFQMEDLQGDIHWISEEVLNQYLSLGWKVCKNGKQRMSYATPTWVPEDEDTETILLLDDYTRASQLFMQAIMSLIQFGEYISWKLPKKCHLILTSNPDNGEYNVTSLDFAQSSRFISFDVDFDLDVWARWAEQEGLRNEVINFALMTPEIFSKQIVNARNYTLFSNAISNLSDLSTFDNLSLINLISQGCFNDENNTVGNLFCTFINNKLDKLISPKEILNDNFEIVEQRLNDNIYNGEEYRADIASILTIRFINYLTTYFNENTDNKSERIINRIKEITQSNKKLLTEDLIFKMIKSLNEKYPSRFRKMMSDSFFRSKILC